MNFSEYKEKIKCVPYAENVNYSIIRMMLRPELQALCVNSVDEDANGIIKIPHKKENAYGKMISVIAISKDAFAGHRRITDIVLPASVWHIPGGAFAGCSNLQRITIPESVTSIWEGTFEGCNQLEDIFYEGSMEDWRKINVIHHKHEIEFGPFIPGTPVHEITGERLRHIPGNDALLTATIHFRCALYD